MKSPLIQFIVALALLVVAVCGYLVWYSDVMAMRASITTTENQITQKIDAEKQLAETRSAFAQIANDESVVQSYFVPQSGVVNFIDMLTSLGSAQGTTVTIVSVSTTGTSAQPSLAINATITGTFDAVMRTVGAIEYVPYDLSVSSLALSLNAPTNWTANLGVAVGLASASTTVSTPEASTSTPQTASTTMSVATTTTSIAPPPKVHAI